MNIAILDGHALNPGDLSWQPLHDLANVKIYDRTPEELIIERSKEAEIIITNKVPFDECTLQQLPALRHIIVTATGYNIIDTLAARQRNITVSNAPAYSTESVAQHVFALLLHIATHTADYAESNRQGLWSEAPDFCYISHPTFELSAKTFGIVGLGNIGHRVAEIAHALNMRVIALTSKKQDQLPSFIQPVTKERLLAQSDVLSLHCPLTEETKTFINPTTLAQMKQGSILLNTSRGPLIDEQAVAQALKSGQLSAFGGDVLSQEPPTKDNPLLSAPNAYTTPHIAWATLEARKRLMQITIYNVRAYIEGQPINVVNL